MNRTKDNSAYSASQQIINVKTPYGTLHIEDVSAAHDHAVMKARELHAFLVLITGEEGRDSFNGLNGELQNSLHWMASRAAGELGEVLSRVAFTSARVAL